LKKENHFNEIKTVLDRIEGDFFGGGGGTHFYEVESVTPGSEKLVDIIRTNPTIFPHLIHRFPADDIINSL